MDKPLKISAFLAKQLPWFMLATVGGIAQNTLVAISPIYLGKVIDIINGLKPGEFTVGVDFYQNLLWYSLLVFIFAVGRHYKRYANFIIAARVGCDLTLEFMSRIFSWKMERMDREKSGDLNSRAIGDIKYITDAISSSLMELYDAGFMMIFNVIILFSLNRTLTLYTALPLLVMLVLSQLVRPLIIRQTNRSRETAGLLNSILERMIAGIRVLRVLGMEDNHAAHYREESANLARQNIRLGLLSNGTIPLYILFNLLALFFMLYLGGRQVIDKSWTLGEFTAYFTIFSFLSRRMFFSTQAFNKIFMGQAAWRRIHSKIFDAHPIHQLTAAAPADKSSAEHLTVSHLSFKYPSARNFILEDISFTARSGNFIGITGPIGSGKTALAMALLGLYPYEGSIKLDKTELGDFNDKELRSRISYLGQDDFMFSASIAENITFKPREWLNELESQRMETVAHWSALADDLALFKEGLATEVGEGGHRISGGQKQRIALARSFFPQSGLLILDDPFSAVDLHTEQKIIGRLKQAFKGKTILLFSHRLGSFINADEIIVLKDKKISEQGTHTQLISADTIYSRIYRAQNWIARHSRHGKEGTR